MSSAVRLPFGLRIDTDQMVSIDAVMRGLSCECVCPSCRARLVAVKGEVVRHHFRHLAEDGACSGARETALHLMAKQIICERLEMTMPRISYPYRPGPIRSATSEPWIDGIRPDVLLQYSNEQVAVEVYVTNRVSPEKLAKFHERDLAALEIDLSFHRDMELTEDLVAGAVLYRAPRRWLREPQSLREARDAYLADLREAERTIKLEAERLRQQAREDETKRSEAWLQAEAARRARLALVEAEQAESRRKAYEEQERKAELARALGRELELERRGPSLQELVAAHGRWDLITPEAWDRFDTAMGIWKMKIMEGYFYEKRGI